MIFSYIERLALSKFLAIMMRKMTSFISPFAFKGEEIKAFMRIITGLMMAYHGWEVFDAQKIAEYASWAPIVSIPNASVTVYFGKGIELVAGVLLAFGLLTRIASVFLIFTMLFITFYIGKGRVWYEEQHPFLFLVLGVFYLFSGGGKWSVDSLIYKRSTHQDSRPGPGTFRP